MVVWPWSERTSTSQGGVPLPSTYRIDPELETAVVTMTGEITDDDFAEVYERLRDDVAVEARLCLLVDLRTASGKQVTTEGVRSFAELPTIFSPRSRRAIVVGSDLGYGMARMYEMLRRDIAGNVRVFRELDAAERWVKRGEHRARPTT